MTAGARLEDGGDTVQARYGFGVAVSRLAGRRAVHHGGDVRGYATYLAYLPDDSLSVVLLMNTEGPVEHAALAARLAAAALGEAPASGGGPAAPPAAPPAAALARLAGRYGAAPGAAPAEFVAAGDQLAFRWQGGPPEPLRPAGGTTFTNGASRFTFVARPGAAPAVWADLTYVVARWTRAAP
jgi:hypothetical protein